MKIIKIFSFFFILTLLTSCQFIKDSFTYKDKTEDFVENLMNKDYDNCIAQMALDSEHGKNTNVDSLKLGLEQFRELIERNFGDGNFDYSLMKAEKMRSTVESNSTPPNTTRAYVEFSNKDEVGVFQLLFDDKTKKIININTLEIKQSKPNMFLFWLVGIIPLGVLFFNIYVIRLIHKSTLNKKWLKYIGVIVLNVPTIIYSAASGLSFMLFNFQFLLGVSFSFMGYLGSVWSFGIPLGGLYWFWKLKIKKKNEDVLTFENNLELPQKQ